MIINVCCFKLPYFESLLSIIHDECNHWWLYMLAYLWTLLCFFDLLFSLCTTTTLNNYHSFKINLSGSESTQMLFLFFKIAFGFLVNFYINFRISLSFPIHSQTHPHKHPPTHHTWSDFNWDLIESVDQLGRIDISKIVNISSP